MELASVFSTGCASHRDQGKERATGCYGSEGWRLLVCLHRLSAEGGGFAVGKRGERSWSPSVSKGCIALAWSGLGLVFHLTRLQGSPLGGGWYPAEGAGERGLMVEASLCQRAACAGWFSWAAAWVGLLATHKSWEGTISQTRVRGAQESWFSLSGRERSSLACLFVSTCLTHSAARIGMTPDGYLSIFQMSSPPFTFFPLFNEK